MLAALEDGRTLSPFMILNHITVLKEQLLQKSLSGAKLKAKWPMALWRIGGQCPGETGGVGIGPFKDHL